MVLDPQGKAVEQFSLPFEVFLDEQQYRDFRERSFIVYHELRLPPGRYELRALIGESASDQLGAALTEFEVPSRDGSLSLSGLVLSQDIRSSSPDRKGPMFVGAHRVVPEGDSRVRPADPVYVYFQIYNLAGGESGPSGRVHLRLQDREGKVRYSRSLPVSRFNLPGAVAVSHELPLELLHLSAGDYSVEVEVEDEISGQRAEARIALRPEDR